LCGWQRIGPGAACRRNARNAVDFAMIGLDTDPAV
jgi:hypothetical protein